MHILMARSSCSLFEKSESFISCGTVSFGCFLWRKKAFSTLSDVRGLILGMLVTCSYAQAAIYGISLRDIWWVMHEHHQFQWSCVTTYSKHGASNQRCAGFRPGVSYIKLTRHGLNDYALCWVGLVVIYSWLLLKLVPMELILRI